MLEFRRIVVLMSWTVLIECRMEPFVVGGSAAKMKQFPHSAYLYFSCFIENKRRKKLAGWICGGSIVNELIILTAAHCLYECSDNRSSFSATVGHSSNAEGGQVSVLSYYIHPNYNDRETSSDIALERLKAPLKFGEYVHRIALMKHPPYYDKAQVAGWGMIDEELNILPEYLQYVDQYVWRIQICRKFIIRLPEGTICGSSGRWRSYISSGDSGSALVVRGYIQIGIVSYKMPVISNGLIVYTDTGYFYKWIVNNTQKLFCAKVY